MDLPDPVSNEALLANYDFTETEIAAEVVFGSGDEQTSVFGIATALSELGAEVSVTESGAVAALTDTPPAPRTDAILNLLDVGRSYYGSIVDAVPLGDAEFRFDLRFARVQTITEVTRRRPLE